MARLGTPPAEMLSWTIRPPAALISGALALDHPLDGRLQHQLVALVEHAVRVGDDATIGLLRLPLVRHVDLDADRVALQHRRHHAELAAQPGHAGAVDES